MLVSNVAPSLLPGGFLEFELVNAIEVIDANSIDVNNIDAIDPTGLPCLK